MKVLHENRMATASWTTVYRRCIDLIRHFPRLDAPTVRAGIGDLLDQAAAPIGQTASVECYREGTEVARRRLPQYQGRRGTALTQTAMSDLLYCREQIHPFNQAIDYMVMFNNCVDVMRRWLTLQMEGLIQDMSSAQAIAERDRLTLLQASLPSSNDYWRVLGRRTTEPAKFALSPNSIWIEWLAPILEVILGLGLTILGVF